MSKVAISAAMLVAMTGLALFSMVLRSPLPVPS